jgi:hypothetical protein
MASMEKHGVGMVLRVFLELENWDLGKKRVVGRLHHYDHHRTEGGLERVVASRNITVSSKENMA